MTSSREKAAPFKGEEATPFKGEEATPFKGKEATLFKRVCLLRSVGPSVPSGSTPF